MASKASLRQRSQPFSKVANSSARQQVRGLAVQSSQRDLPNLGGPYKEQGNRTLISILPKVISPSPKDIFGWFGTVLLSSLLKFFVKIDISGILWCLIEIWLELVGVGGKEFSNEHTKGCS